MRLSRTRLGAAVDVPVAPDREIVRDVHLIIGVAAIALNALAGLWGAWRWWRIASPGPFWRLLRAGQLAVVIEVADGGVEVALGHKLSTLHLVYGLLPLLVAFIAEALRLSSAEMVLAARGYESAADVGRQPPEEQRAVATAIFQREMGVMALAALVVVVLLARAAMTAG